MEKVRTQKGYYKIMKGHRFYEILEAHRKGEDLSVFIPTNPAEAELLANLAGGTGGSTGGSAMVPVTMPYNNPNIGNMYYGMAVPAFNKIKVNVLEAFDTVFRLECNKTLQEICSQASSLQEVIESSYSISQSGHISLFRAESKTYSLPTSEESGYEQMFDHDYISVLLALGFTDDGKLGLCVMPKKGSASYTSSELVLLDESNGLYEAFVNAGVIEYDLSEFKYTNSPSGEPNYPNILIITRIIGDDIFDLNKLEKFDALTFE
jgi:hypothetical protein